MIKIGQTVKVKSLKQMRDLTKVGFRKQVVLKSGLIFSAYMLVYADQIGRITKIAKPGDDNQLTANSYKIGEIDIYWDESLIEVVEEGRK